MQAKKTYSGYQHLGKRSAQEDRFYTDSRVIDGVDFYILAVADGMGGLNSGDLAAELAIQEIRKFFSDIDTSNINFLRESLAKAFFSSNEKIRFESEQKPGSSGMGTTLTCAVVVGKKMFVSHVGDSRAYLVTDDKIHQCTVDHTAYQDGINNGLDVTSIKIGKNALTRCLDGDLNFEPDVSETFDFTDGQILLCSDGVSGVLENKDIHKIVSSSPNAHSCVTNVVEKAIANNASDNVTAVCLAVQKRSSSHNTFPQLKNGKKKPQRKSSLMLSILMVGVLSVTGWSGYKYFEMNSSDALTQETELTVSNESELAHNANEANYIEDRDEVTPEMIDERIISEIDHNNNQTGIGIPEGTNQEEERRANGQEEESRADEQEEESRADEQEEERRADEQEEESRADEQEEERRADEQEEKDEEYAPEENNSTSIKTNDLESESVDTDSETSGFGFNGYWQDELESRYCIRVYTLTNEERISDKLKEFQGKNIRARAFPSPGKEDAKIICLGQFASEDEADKFLTESRQKNENWLTEDSSVFRFNSIPENQK